MNKTITHSLTFKTYTIHCLKKKEQIAMHLTTIEEKAAFYLLTYGFNIKRKNKRNETSIRSINPI